MNSFTLEGTSKTPRVEFNSQTGVLELSGRSIPENSIEFYRPLLQWLEEYASCPQSETVLILRMEYFNTSSSKCLIDIFRKLEKIHLHGVNVYVKWYYEQEDEDMQHSGEDFREIIRLPIQMIELQEESSK
ncbi:DUF1987 domain-containing protein [Cesiribacter andamanensis]|uniref:SiaC family regulatory phosphoprotein domain-containing protein n=1 Tax=Cesiribacter andamanensis AMV16 TaxID=1279009 RepID=M7N5D2_9BACT|nr:DUF1987 domain-containing protein [Cesiribacter andamanensis]EMR02436.1 hypothetical protein ADICEAN_02422 [Cesiribacter andamanensis AMV16]